MSLKNIDLTKILQSKIIVSYPFVYDKSKVQQLDTKNIIKLKNEMLKDFLPYTKNFFGKYHLQDDNPLTITFPMICNSNFTRSIDFVKDNKITQKIDINNIKLYFFEKSIAILTIEYAIPQNISNKEFLYYHQKLSTIEKRSKQNIRISCEKDFKYYFEFINSIISNYVAETNNIFCRSNLYTYSLIVANATEQDKQIQNFIEPLLQYRNSLDEISITQSYIAFVQQVPNIYTIANENVVVHIGIKQKSCNNNFIDNEFFNKYQNNHFLTYLITLFQATKIEQLIIKAFLQEDKNKDLKNIRFIKSEILHFIANGDFTKISNNSIRNNLYKFYRKKFEIKDMLQEIKTVSEELKNELENIIEDKKAQTDKIRNFIIGVVGIILAIIQTYQAF